MQPWTVRYGWWPALGGLAVMTAGHALLPAPVDHPVEIVGGFVSLLEMCVLMLWLCGVVLREIHQSITPRMARMLHEVSEALLEAWRHRHDA